MGTGNVCKDLGFKNAEAMLARARIVAEIARIIRAKRLTQTAAAKVLGLSQPKVSALLKRALPGLFPGAVDRASQPLGVRREDRRYAEAQKPGDRARISRLCMSATPVSFASAGSLLIRHLSAPG